MGPRCYAWALSSCSEQGPPPTVVGGLPTVAAPPLRSTGSRCGGFSSCGTWALERRLSGCGARAQPLHGMWDLPGPGPEPVSPALADGLPTTAPPGKAPEASFFVENLIFTSLSLMF